MLAKIVFEEHRAIAGRLKAVVELRTIIPNKVKLIQDMSIAYFSKDWIAKVEKYMHDPIMYDANETKDWLNRSKNANKKQNDLLQFILNDIETKPINDVKVHVKLESLLKDETKIIKNWKQQEARIIVW